MRNAHKILVRKSEKKESFGKTKSRWMNKDLKETIHESAD